MHTYATPSWLLNTNSPRTHANVTQQMITSPSNQDEEEEQPIATANRRKRRKIAQNTSRTSQREPANATTEKSIPAPNVPQETEALPAFPQGMLKEPIPEPTTNEKGEKSKWEIRRQFVFLTYPRCDLLVAQFVEEFRRLNHYPDRYIGCRENHALKQDEAYAGRHFHVLMDMGKTKSDHAKKVSSHTAWDIKVTTPGPDGKTVYHPNIAGVRSQYLAYKYVTKLEHSDDVVFEDEQRHTGFANPGLGANKPASKNTNWHTMMAKPNEEEMRAAIRALQPQEAINNARNIDYFIQKQFAIAPATSWKWPSNTQVRPWKRYDAIQAWVDMFLRHPRKGRQISLWIIGESRAGKTSWARQQGNHSYMKGGFDAKLFHSNVDYYVMDDVKIQDFAYYNELMQGIEFTYTGKYERMRTFDAGAKHGRNGIPVMWTTNYDPRQKFNRDVDLKWLRENVLFVDLQQLKMKLDQGEPDTEYPCQSRSREQFFDNHAMKTTSPIVDYPRCWPEYVAQSQEERRKPYLAFNIFRAWRQTRRRRSQLLRQFGHRWLHITRKNTRVGQHHP